MPLPTLKRALVFFDLETTGTELSKDRIIELAAIRVETYGMRTTLEMRLNPEMPIPPASTAVHGIRDEDVADKPCFKDVAARVLAFFSEADVAGYNVRRFDVPMLEAEFARAGVASPLGSALVVDAYEIFTRMVSHSLDGALRFFCGRSHENAHAAMADVVATMDVLSAQLDRYPELPRDPAALAAAVQPEGADRFLDPLGKLIRNEEGEPALNFGKYRGRTLKELARADEGYLRWMLTKDFHPNVTGFIRQALEGSRSGAESARKREPW